MGNFMGNSMGNSMENSESYSLDNSVDTPTDNNDIFTYDYCFSRLKNEMLQHSYIPEKDLINIYHIFDYYCKSYEGGEYFPNSEEMLMKLIKTVYCICIMREIPNDIGHLVFLELSDHIYSYVNTIYQQSFDDIKDLVNKFKSEFTEYEIKISRLNFLVNFELNYTSVHKSYHVWNCMNGKHPLSSYFNFSKRNNSEKDEVKRVNGLIIPLIHPDVILSHKDIDDIMKLIISEYKEKIIIGRSYQFRIAVEILKKTSENDAQVTLQDDAQVTLQDDGACPE